jgi:hypothetical protein
MTLKYPGEPTLTGLINSDERDDLRKQLLHLGPKIVFAGCHWHAQQSGSQKAAGYAAHLFREVYGEWPRSRDRTAAPQRVDAVQAWISKRPKRSKR